MKRYCATVQGRRLHYRRGGSGPALVALHASPGSSQALVPLAECLARHFTVIAPDTPGYGGSAPLPQLEPTMADYADALAAGITSLGLTGFHLYGTHTGAKIALEFTIRHPHLVSGLVLDGIGLYEDEERAELLSHYTPSLDPQWDGGHLLRGWAMRRDMELFWPWFRREADALFSLEPASELELHNMAVDLLRAGPGYWKGYHAAFRYDAGEALHSLRRPTLMLAAANDPLLEHLNRLGNTAPTVSVSTPSEEHQDQAGHPVIAEFLQDLTQPPSPAAASPDVSLVLARGESSAGDELHVDATGGQVHLRVWRGPGKVPLILLHGSPGSGADLVEKAAGLAAGQTVIAFDLPGHGDSSPPAGHHIEAFAAPLLEVLERLEVEEFDLYGLQMGATVAATVARDAATRVRRCILEELPLPSTAEARETLERLAQPLEVRWDGGHLLWAWNFLRDRTIWEPWFRRTAACTREAVRLPGTNELHGMLVEFMKGALTHHHLAEAVLACPVADVLGQVKCDILLRTWPSRAAASLMSDSTASVEGRKLRVVESGVNSLLDPQVVAGFLGGHAARGGRA